MLASGQTICLNMIVRNEAPVIRRCLESVLPFIDHWVIVDTGSKDGTQDVIREYLSDVPGELHERPWKDFGTNRSEALELARGKADYILIIDADDVLDTVLGKTIPLELSDDAYSFEIVDGGVVYRRTQLVRDALPWRYVGVLHEFITCRAAKPAVPLPVFRMLRKHDGARQKDAETYRRDAALLERVIQAETDLFLAARYRFYLAQSYYDCQQWEKALINYRQRAGLGFWQEEVFVSLYRVAQLMERLKHPRQEIIETYQRASEVQPARAEALHALSKFCRLSGLYTEGLRYAEQALRINQPADGLYVEPWIYEVGILDEYAASAFWCGRYWESLDANLKILASGKLPAKNVQRTVANIQHARDRLEHEKSAVFSTKKTLEPAAAVFPPHSQFAISNKIARHIADHPQTAEWSKANTDHPRLGIVIPYRNREAQLKKFLPHLISYFSRDVEARKIKPLIVVSEQTDDRKFNVGWTRNAGALAVGNYCDYFCFHDVDYLPLWADYSYSSTPVRSIRWGIDGRPVRIAPGNGLRVTVPRDGFGAVVLVDKGQFLAANGYANQYEGWGYEDNDLKLRLDLLGFKTGVREGTFTPLDHDSAGFTASGAPSEDSVRNAALFDKLKSQYEKTRHFPEGIRSITLSAIEVSFERWVGLDDSESLLVCRLKVGQPEMRASSDAMPGLVAADR